MPILHGLAMQQPSCFDTLADYEPGVEISLSVEQRTHREPYKIEISCSLSSSCLKRLEMFLCLKAPRVRDTQHTDGRDPVSEEPFQGEECQSELALAKAFFDNMSAALTEVGNFLNPLPSVIYKHALAL